MFHSEAEQAQTEEGRLQEKAKPEQSRRSKACKVSAVVLTTKAAAPKG